jgi:hypothetical protein
MSKGQIHFGLTYKDRPFINDIRNCQMIGRRKDTFRNFVEEYVNKVKIIDQTIQE